MRQRHKRQNCGAGAVTGQAYLRRRPKVENTETSKRQNFGAQSFRAMRICESPININAATSKKRQKMRTQSVRRMQFALRPTNRKYAIGKKRQNCGAEIVRAIQFWLNREYRNMEKYKKPEFREQIGDGSFVFGSTSENRKCGNAKIGRIAGTARRWAVRIWVGIRK